MRCAFFFSLPVSLDLGWTECTVCDWWCQKWGRDWVGFNIQHASESLVFLSPGLSRCDDILGTSAMKLCRTCWRASHEKCGWAFNVDQLQCCRSAVLWLQPEVSSGILHKWGVTRFGKS